TAESVEHRLATALTKLGPTYVKLGQFLATRPDVVGVALARDLEQLQDHMPPFPQAEAERAATVSLGRPSAEAGRGVPPLWAWPFANVFPRSGLPVAAASIAQVHRAEVGHGGAARA